MPHLLPVSAPPTVHPFVPVRLDNSLDPMLGYAIFWRRIRGELRLQASRNPIMFRKILIANRGEIAMRIIRGCRELNIATAAIYSEADSSGIYVKKADESYLVGPGPVKGFLTESRSWKSPSASAPTQSIPDTDSSLKTPNSPGSAKPPASPLSVRLPRRSTSWAAK